MDDLVKRLREVAEEKHREAWGRLDGGQDISISAMLAEEAADRIEELEAELAKAREWNRQMVEKAASGGVLDGYRELGMKLLAAEGQASDNLERAERAEAMLKEAVEALQVIADEKGKCEHCGKIAEGEGRGYVTCDGERDADYRPYYHCRWEGIDAAEFARATLARIAQEGKE